MTGPINGLFQIIRRRLNRFRRQLDTLVQMLGDRLLQPRLLQGIGTMAAAGMLHVDAEGANAQG